MPLRIGFIGLGAMGAPMAAHIHRRQPRHPLIVHARRRESAGDLLAQGAQWAPTPAEVAAQAEVVIAMLPDLPELRSVLDGGQGLLAGVTRPTTVVVCSTSSPAATRDLGAELRRRTGGLVALVDAPVSGGVEGARAGDLSIFVGGEPAAAASAARALRPCGRCSHLGPLGAGQVAKAANQHIVAATTAALAEALVVAERSGLDLAQLVPLLAGGYAGSRLLEVKGEKFITHDHSPASPASFMIKDLAFALDEASRTATPTPVLRAAARLYERMVAAGMGDLDSAGLQAFLHGEEA